MRRILERLWKNKEKKPVRLENDVKNEAFLKVAGEQFKILAKKGLSIPVFTL